MSLTVREGEVVALVGPSGCGKTTTLRCINRLEEPDAGTITLDGTDLATLDVISHRRACGYVIQEVGLMPHWTIRQNVATVPRLLGWDPEAREARAAELLDAVGLPPATFGDRRPSQLSGGERQRVGIARALAARPRLLLMDEPFGALDPLTRAEMHALIKALRVREPTTAVFVTHDLAEAMVLADRVAVMRAGTVAQVATPEALRASPADPWVEAFLRSVLRLSVE
ncbi:MAG: ATP-binding cassette domain-containing protein [Nitrospinota bacterium]